MADPVIILSHPQMAENIGATARVMRNFGLHELRLIAPRDGWPNAKAGPLAAGAFSAMAPVRVFPDTAAAIKDLQTVYAVTARIRGMQKPVFHPADAMQSLVENVGPESRFGLLFGGEASGLSNSEVTLCDAVITYPVSDDFSSLNLSQAVGVSAYAWRNLAMKKAELVRPQRGEISPIATKDELAGLVAHLEAELHDAGFFYPPEKAGIMMQNLQNMLVRGKLSQQEVQTFRGVIKALSKGRGKRT